MPGGLISIHGSILLFGTAGLFGKFLNFDAVLIVQGRTMIAFVALVLVHWLAGASLLALLLDLLLPGLLLDVAFIQLLHLL